MSYVALATDSFDEVTAFYGDFAGFPVVDEWDRARGRSCRFDLGGGLRLEILDNAREPVPAALATPGDRIHLVIEVDDITSAQQRLGVDPDAVRPVSWGASLFELRDPDGVRVTFLQWHDPKEQQP